MRDLARRLAVPLLLATVLAGCMAPSHVRYWELTSSVEWTGDNDGVFLEQGPHCPSLHFDGEGITLTRAWGEPDPEKGVLGRRWTGDAPDGATTGSGFDHWLGDGVLRGTVGGDAILAVSWRGDTPLLDGEAGFDGWTRTIPYEHDGLQVNETLTLRDHGTVPLKVHTQRERTCE